MKEMDYVARSQFIARAYGGGTEMSRLGASPPLEVRFENAERYGALF